MLLVPCPNCGPRNAADMRYVGESHSRPAPDAVSPDEWRAYLYLEDNPAGLLKETWYCRSGCRRFFTLTRDTTTNEFTNNPTPSRKLGGKA
jgi:heterotetrameric sarcosine oxidase delta subunit